MLQVITKFNAATRNSLNGLKNAWCFQWAFRVDVIIFLIAIPCAFYFGKNAVEYVLLIGSVFLILIIEIINSAIETTVNRISFEYHELSGLAKDLGSSAIFLGIINVFITWGIIMFF
jgi:diacylglycerol kinase (ATP)